METTSTQATWSTRAGDAHRIGAWPLERDRRCRDGFVSWGDFFWGCDPIEFRNRRLAGSDALPEGIPVGIEDAPVADAVRSDNANQDAITIDLVARDVVGEFIEGYHGVCGVLFFFRRSAN